MKFSCCFHRSFCLKVRCQVLKFELCQIKLG